MLLARVDDKKANKVRRILRPAIKHKSESGSSSDLDSYLFFYHLHQLERIFLESFESARAAAIYRDIRYIAIFYIYRDTRYIAIFFSHIAIQMCTGIDGVARG